MMYSVKQLSEMSGIPKATLYDRIQNFDLIGRRVGPKSIRVDEADWKKFLDRVRVTGIDDLKRVDKFYRR